MFRCLQAIVHLRKGKFVELQVDAQNPLGIVNRGSPRELFGFCLERRVAMVVDWILWEKNSLADEMSRLVISDDYMLRKFLFR